MTRRLWCGAAVVAAAVAFFVSLTTGVFGKFGTVVLDDYLCALVPCTAGLLCLARARRAWLMEPGREWLGWAMLGVSCLLWGGGGVVWTVYEVHLAREVPFPSLADVGYLLAVPPTVVGVGWLSGGRGGLRVQLRDVADGAIAGSALLFVSWATVLGPVFRDSDGTLLARGIGLAYPASDVLVAAAALVAVARANGPYRLVLTLVGCGLGSVAVSDTSFAWFTAQGSYATGNLFDVGYVLGYALIALAAYYPPVQHQLAGPARHAPHVRTDRVLPTSRGVPPGRPAATHHVVPSGEGGPVGPQDLYASVTMLLPYLPVALTGVVGVAVGLPNRPMGPFLFWDALAMFALLLVRQLLSLSANQSMTRRLRGIVTALEERERELAHRAFHDHLTGLPNRARFYQTLTDPEPGQTERPIAVVLIDLDDFKLVNDTHGHHIGDALLVEAAARLQAAAGAGDLVARLGGDEFAIIAYGLGDSHAADTFVLRIADSLADPMRLPGSSVPIHASIGVCGPSSSTDPRQMLQQADQAMYRAKHHRRTVALP